MKTEERTPEYLRVSDVARILHVSPRTVTRWASENKLEYVRTLGGHRRFPAHAVLDLASRLSGGATVKEPPAGAGGDREIRLP